MDLSELFERMGLRASQRRQVGGVNVPIRGQDVEAIALFTIDEVCHGTQVTPIGSTPTRPTSPAGCRS